MAIVGIVLYAALVGRREPAAEALGMGRFEEALAQADTSADAGRESLYTAAVAAKHLCRWRRSEELLGRILDDDDDGEAWLELGLVHCYQGRHSEAASCFERAEASRSDLLESLTLHRAFNEERRGEHQRARSLFEEIEVPLETKLRTDIGSGEPLFVEWFLQSAALWAAMGRDAKSDWAAAEGRRAAGDSRLHELI